MSKKILKIIFILVLFFGIFSIAKNSQATWQEDLEAQFDIVETFDDLQNWVGSENNGGCYNSEGTCDLPLLQNGSAGIWDMYEDYSSTGGCSGPEAGDYWIADHGAEYEWSGTKSLRMSYSDPLITHSDNYDYRLDFNSGGTYQAQAGDVISGQMSLAQATITGIVKYPDHGSWTSGDALGEFYVTDKTGTFQNGEEVTINGNSNSATLASGELEGYSECKDRLGPARIGMYFGDGTPESGYDDLHLFFMVKFAPDSIKYLSQVSRYAYIGTWKFYELEQGFADIYNWEEGTGRAETCQCDQDLHAYGDNFLITNITGGGTSYPHNAHKANIFPTAGYDDGIDPSWGSFCGLSNCWTYKRTNFDANDSINFTANNFMSEYEAGNWIGMEIHWKIGTLGNNDAEYEEWYYDESGNIISHDSQTGIRAKRQFDNRVNKLVLGGNRFAQTYDLQEGDSTNSVFYIDDLMIDGSQIGPTYFSLLNGTADTTSPTAPSGLSVL